MRRLPFIFSSLALAALLIAAAPPAPPRPPPGLITPGRPGVTNLWPGYIRIVIDPAGNTIKTRFAILESRSGKYVAADGTISADAPVYRTYTDWGYESGIVVRVQTNTKYRFRVIARGAQ